MEEVKYIPGDLIMCKDDPNIFIPGDKVNVVVESSNYRHVRTVVRQRNSIMSHQILESQIEHIRLTPAILEANGFKKCKFGDGYCIINRPTFSIFLEKEDDKNLIITLGGATLMHCNFAHELQHFLFGLGLNSELKV